MSGADFVPVSLAGLDSSERQSLPEVPEQDGVEHEHALRSLRPHVSDPGPLHGPYPRAEHEVHHSDIGPFGLRTGRALHTRVEDGIDFIRIQGVRVLLLAPG